MFLVLLVLCYLYYTGMSANFETPDIFPLLNRKWPETDLGTANKHSSEKILNKYSISTNG